jgi:hypothetical protein
LTEQVVSQGVVQSASLGMTALGVDGLDHASDIAWPPPPW